MQYTCPECGHIGAHPEDMPAPTYHKCMPEKITMMKSQNGKIIIESDEHANETDIKLLKSREGDEATIEFHESYPDSYRVKIISVNKDGTFTGKLIDVASCM